VYLRKFPQGYSCRVMKLTTQLRLLSRSRIYISTSHTSLRGGVELHIKETVSYICDIEDGGFASTILTCIFGVASRVRISAGLSASILGFFHEIEHTSHFSAARSTQEIFSLLEHWNRRVRIPLKAYMFVCVYSVFVLGSGLATGWSPSKESYWLL
jgi:hypothetical protein